MADRYHCLKTDDAFIQIVSFCTSIAIYCSSTHPQPPGQYGGKIAAHIPSMSHVKVVCGLACLSTDVHNVVGIKCKAHLSLMLRESLTFSKNWILQAIWTGCNNISVIWNVWYSSLWLAHPHYKHVQMYYINWFEIILIREYQF